VLVGTADTVVTGGRLVTRRHHPRPSSTPDAPGTVAATGAPAATAAPEVGP
jgi:hypothetical protein